MTGWTEGNAQFDWTASAPRSAAVYKGASKILNNCLEFNDANSDSGIVTTTSGGSLKSITFNWYFRNNPERSILVYGSNTPYTSPAQLFDEATAGTLLGEISYNAEPQTLTIEGDYKYLGLRSSYRSLQIEEISVVWDDGREAVEVEVGETGYATLTPTKALDFSDAAYIKAYKAAVSGDVITFTKVEQVAAGEGVLLYAEGGATEDILVGTKAAKDGDNAFVGVTEEIASLPSNSGSKTNYILNSGSSGVGFYLAAGQKVAAGKAYLSVEAVVGAKQFIAMKLDGGVATGIGRVEAEGTAGKVYRLNGARAANLYPKGIYIKNGKKYVAR